MLSMASVVPGAALADGGVTLSRDCNHSGGGATLGVGRYGGRKLEQLGIAGGTVSSVHVPAGYTAILYVSPNFKGRSVTLTADADCLQGTGFDDATYAVVVKGPRPPRPASSSGSGAAAVHGASASGSGGQSLDVSQTAAIDAVLAQGDIEAVRAMLRAGTPSASSIAQRAVTKGDIAVLEEVMLTEPRVVNNELFVAALMNPEMARSVLSFAAEGHMDLNAALQAVLRLSLKGEQREILTDLLDQGADSAAAVRYAVSKADVPLLTELLDQYQADPNLALTSAASAGSIQMVNLLVDRGADPTPALAPAIEHGTLKVVSALIDAGASVGDPALLGKAVRKGDERMVRTLLAAGAAPDDGMSIAVEAKQAAVARALIESGARGDDPAFLQKAAAQGDEATLAVLLESGAPPQAAVRDAVRGGSAEVMARLIQAGADVSDPQWLVDATGASSSGALQSLLQAGGDPDTRDSGGRPLIVIAASVADVETLNALLRAGADKEAVDAGGGRAIHAAVQRNTGELPIVKRLIEVGVDVNAPNGDGKLPRALSSGIRVPWVLRSAGARKE